MFIFSNEIDRANADRSWSDVNILKWFLCKISVGTSSSSIDSVIVLIAADDKTSQCEALYGADVRCAEFGIL